MRPFIPKGSVLHVTRVLAHEIRPGDVLCYVDRDGPVAHRVIRIRSGETGPVFETRGDAQQGIEPVPFSAAIYRVERVEHPLIAYDTQGLFGTMVARAAVRGGLAWLLLKASATIGGRILRKTGPMPGRKPPLE